MGKIKSKLIRKAAKTLNTENVELSNNFEKNKKILNELGMSKKLRNQLAGLIAKNKREKRAESQ